MVKLIRHYVGSLVIFAMLISLIGTTYTGMQDTYGFTNTYTGNEGTKNIAQTITELGIIQRLNNIMDGIFQIANPTGLADILGGIALVGFGALGFVAELVVLPITIFGLLTNFYYIPPIVSTGLGLLIMVYVGFILLSARTKSEL